MFFSNLFLYVCISITASMIIASTPVMATHERGQLHPTKKKKNKIEIVYPDNAPGIASDFKSRLGINGQMRPAHLVHQGIDIKGPVGQPIIAVADGIVLDAVVEECWGPTIVIDHGTAYDGKRLIALYGHLGEMIVESGSKIVRGQLIGRLGDNEHNFKCIYGVRHLHFQIGQKYRSDNREHQWGWSFFLEDGNRSLNPHLYWEGGIGIITCFNPKSNPKTGYITYPVPCN